MNYFSKDQISRFKEHSFQFLEVSSEDHNLTITLNRPDQKNALHPKMIDELAFVFQYAHENKSIWNIIIKAKGNVFCSGADLKAMRGDYGIITSTVPSTNEQVIIANLCKKLYKPILVLVHADVYAGGTFFLTGATEVIAMKQIRINLSEVKRGIFPFQLMGSLCEVTNPKTALRWALMGECWSAHKALENGLIQTLVEDEQELEEEAKKWLEKISLNSPRAIQLGLEAYDNFLKLDNSQIYLKSMLHKSLETKDSIEGINAFREKRKPNWVGE